MKRANNSGETSIDFGDCKKNCQDQSQDSKMLPTDMRIEGITAPGFEAVRRKFEELFRDRKEADAQVCVYHKGQKVVDLFGTRKRENGQLQREYNGDAIQPIFSASKNVTAICMGMLVDRGLIKDYDDKIVDYWPEFGKNDKSEITIADVLRHEAGLPWMYETMGAKDFTTLAVKRNIVGKVLENESKQAPNLCELNPQPTREYHAVTRGLICNEITRRVDPSGRTLAEFMREELYEKLGLEVLLTPTEFDSSLEEKIPYVNVPGPLGLLKESWSTSKEDSRKISMPTLHEMGSLLRDMINDYPVLMRKENRFSLKELLYFLRMVRRPSLLDSLGFLNIIDGGRELLNGENFRKIEFASANIFASARGLSKLGVYMTGKGTAFGHSIMSVETWEKMHSEEIQRSDIMFGGARTSFTAGGLNHFKDLEDDVSIERRLKNGRNGFFGWIGFGGSTFQWNPMEEVSFAYISTSVAFYDLFNEKAGGVQEIVMECVKNLKLETQYTQ